MFVGCGASREIFSWGGWMGWSRPCQAIMRKKPLPVITSWVVGCLRAYKKSSSQNFVPLTWPYFLGVKTVGIWDRWGFNVRSPHHGFHLRVIGQILSARKTWILWFLRLICIFSNLPLKVGIPNFWSVDLGRSTKLFLQVWFLRAGLYWVRFFLLVQTRVGCSKKVCWLES